MLPKGQEILREQRNICTLCWLLAICPSHPRPIIPPSLSSGLRKVDFYRLHHSGSLTLASRWIWLPEDTSRRLESEGERRAKVFTLTPLPACPCPGSSGVCTYSAWARALTGLPEHRTGAPSDPEPPWFPLLLALRSPLSPGGSLNSAPTSSNHSLIKCSSATLVRVCHPSLFRLTGTMVFQNYKIQSLENI